MINKITAVTAVLAVGIIAGCGGGSGSTPSVVSGKVADGYLEKATVFLDKNGNYKMDAGEPSTITDANGAYALNIDAADMGKYPIVAMITKGVTIDKDNTAGIAVTNSYLLSMPKSSISGTVGSNFISPMSSQLREMMETGKYTTIQQAMDALNVQLGFTQGTNVMTDYMAANNTTMHIAAQNMASLMGDQMGQVFVPAGSGTIVDVNRYRNMMGTIFSYMPTITGPNAQTAMMNLSGTMTATLGNMPMMNSTQPYQNMSSAFRGGKMH